MLSYFDRVFNTSTELDLASRIYVLVYKSLCFTMSVSLLWISLHNVRLASVTHSCHFIPNLVVWIAYVEF